MIDYVLGKWLIESKSLKLHFWIIPPPLCFHENCTITIVRRLIDLLTPHWLRIGGYWYPRGGIPIDVFWQTGPVPQDLWVPDQNVKNYHGRWLINHFNISFYYIVLKYYTQLHNRARSCL